jgi:hypothetical protein
MSDEKVTRAAEDVLQFAEELEASGQAVLGGDQLAFAKAALHKWIDGATAIVAVPAFGRVAVIDASGKQSTISGYELSFALSKPVGGD